MSIVLDTPEQISMWVLLSRRSQLHLHAKGLRFPGLFASLKRDGLSNKRTAKGALADINKIIEAAGGPPDSRA